MKYPSIVGIVFLIVFASQSQAKTYQLYFLGGQSNMDGYGYTNDLDKAEAGPVSGVRIFHGNTSADTKPTDGRGIWAGRISDSGQDGDGKVWDHGEIVRKAQAAFAEKDSAAALVTSTDMYGYSDKWHYDSKGYVDLGKQFAEALRDIGR